jgi:hypothetical protein
MRLLQCLALLGRLILFSVIGKALLVAVNAAGADPQRWLQALLPGLDAEPAAWLIAMIAGVCFYALELKARSPARGAVTELPSEDASNGPLGLRVVWPQDHAQQIRGYPPER